MKKGQLTSTQAVMWILAITGFLIAGYATITILGKENVDVFSRETCHLSVITRATVPDVAQAQIPLKCSTNKFCFTTLSDGTCTQFAGESDVQRVMLPKNDVDRSARLVERMSANALYDCWTMMGEGKLDIFGSASKSLGLDSGSPTCVVCSRLAVADDIRTDKSFYSSLKNQINVNSFIESTPVSSGGDTYLSVLSQKGITGFRPLEEYKFSALEAKDIPVTIDGDQIAFIFSQVKSKKVGDVLETLGFAAAGGTFILPGGTGTALALGAASHPLVTIVGGGIVGGIASVNALLGQQVAAGYCGQISDSSTGNAPGCSLVRAVNYNLDSLNAFCPGTIQGNP